MLSYNPNKRTSQVAAGPSIRFWRDALGSDKQLPLSPEDPYVNSEDVLFPGELRSFHALQDLQGKTWVVTHVTIALFCCLSFAMDS